MSALRKLQLPPNPQDAFARLLRSADAANGRRDWARAESGYAEALSLDPLRADLWVQYGHALKEQGRREEAARAYGQATTLEPERAETREHLAVLLQALGRREPAAVEFAAALALDPGRTGARAALRSLGAPTAISDASTAPFRDVDDLPVRRADDAMRPTGRRPAWSGGLRSIPSRLTPRPVRDAVFFLHLHKTGGLTLDDVLGRAFSPARTCPIKDDHLHLYAPEELDEFDFFSGHFDVGALRLLRRPVRTLSMLRKPRARLISFYRFHAGHDLGGKHGVNDFAQMANAMTAEAFFEDERVRRAPEVFNHYLTVFGLTYHQVRGACRVGVDRVPEALVDRAVARVRGLDAIGLLERFDESVALACATLDVPPPVAIRKINQTDTLAAKMKGEAVPPVVSTPRLEAALADLLRFDEVIYAAAAAEFERRLGIFRAGAVPA